MYIDEQLEFSDAQAITTTAVATNVIDLSSIADIGSGEAMAVVFTVSVAGKVSAGDEDYTFAVEVTDNADQSTGDEFTIGSRAFQSGTPATGTFDADLLAVGFKFAIAVSALNISEAQQYLGVRYTTAGTSPAITVDAALVPASVVALSNDYASGFTVS